MLGGAVIMIVRWHSARDGASRLIMPVPDGRRVADSRAAPDDRRSQQPGVCARKPPSSSRPGVFNDDEAGSILAIRAHIGTSIGHDGYNR